MAELYLILLKFTKILNNELIQEFLVFADIKH